MAVAVHHLTTNSDSATTTSYTTASIAPNANRLLVCFVEIAVATAPTPTVTVSGCGVTWELIARNSSGTSVPEARSIYAFRALGSPTSGALTITAASDVTHGIWTVVECSGVVTTGTNGSGAVAQSVNARSGGDVTSVSTALATAVTAGNATLAAVALQSVQETLTAGSGWTSVRQQTVAGPQSSMMTEFAGTAQQSVTASWTTATNAFLIGLEVVAAGGDTEAPTVPASVSATASSPTQVDLSWTASTDNVGVTGYRIRRDGVDIGTVGGAVLSYSDTTAQGSTAYSYTVSASDDAGNRSAESAAATITTPAKSTSFQVWNGTSLVPLVIRMWDGAALVPVGGGDTTDTEAPTRPIGVTASAPNPTRVDLSWTASTDNVEVDGYRIRRDGTVVGDTTGNTYTDTTVTASTTYSYTVQAFDEAGNDSPESASVSVTTPAATDTTKPSVPNGLVATAVSYDQIDLTWNPSTDNVEMSHYVVLRDDAVIDDRVTTTQYSATGLSPSTTYSFTVQAVDTSGNASAESSAASATTTANTGGGGGGGAVTGDFIIGLTAKQIQSLPKTGPEWDRLKQQANATYNHIADNGKTDGSGNAVAGALYYVATGDSGVKSKVVNALITVQNTPSGSWQHAAVSRKLGGWALAGNLVGHNTTEWHNFLKKMLSFDTGTHGRTTPLSKAAWHWDNNHGGAAMLAYVFICAVLGIKSETIGGYPGGLDAANKWLRGFCGDRSSTGFGHTRSTNPSYGSMGSTGEAIDRGWHMDENRPYGIGPTTSMWGSAVPSTREGAVPSDAIRGTTANHPTVGSDGRHYVPGNAGRRTVAAVVLAAQGYKDVWTVGDHALYRWRAWFERMYGDVEGAAHYAYDPIIRKVYRQNFNVSGFQHIPSGSGETITATDWLALEPSWPIRPSTLP